MSKKILYLILSCAMLSFASCDDFLDVNPPSGFTPEYVFSSENEIKSFMTQIYSAMTGDGLYGNNLANGLDTNTDVEFKSLSNNTVASGGNDIACFDARPYWSILNDTRNNEKVQKT